MNGENIAVVGRDSSIGDRNAYNSALVRPVKPNRLPALHVGTFVQ